MRRLYTLVLYLLTPLVLVRLVFRGFRAPAYWHRWPERFGFIKPLAEPTAIWIHAVSVGEVQATQPLIRVLRERLDPAQILISTLTPTGSDRAQHLYGGIPANVYAPYDLPDVVERFLERVKPSLVLVMETEIWPNLFNACHQKGIPIFMVNARMSEKSFNRYLRVSGLVEETLQQVTAILVQGLADCQRLEKLGAPADRLHVTGSIKFDIELPPSLTEQAEALRRTWGVERPVWIAASTHDGEDEIVLDAFRQLQEEIPNALLVLVPRHPERFSRVEALCSREGFITVLRSSGKSCGSDAKVFIGDTMGELTVFFAAADVAFMGGSLVPAGGHNPLEPASLGVPQVFGPYMFNFSDASHWLLESGAAMQVNNADEIAQRVGYWLVHANSRHDAGQQGHEVVEGHKGATDIAIKLLEPYLP